MRKFAIFSDSSCDLPVNLTKENDITIIPIKASFDGINKFVEGVDITKEEFYNHIQKEKITPKTYFPTVKEYVTHFKKNLEQGQDILCLCLSSKLSKSYYNALRAKDILMHIYKEREIIIMDSMLASAAQGLLVFNAVRLRNESVDITVVHQKLVESQKSAVTLFTLNSLEQLARGGRMSKATAMIATALRINPIIHMEDGALVSKEKAFGRKKAIAMIGDLAIEMINGKVGEYDMCVFHSRSEDEAKGIEFTMQDNFGARSICPPIEIGVSIGSHTGSSVVALSFLKRAVRG